MAAVHNQSSRQHPHSRLRSSTDPFVDPVPRAKQRPPPPPPKTSSTTRMPVALPKSSPTRDPNLTEAVRDTVTVRQQDSNSRSKVSRSQTAASVFFSLILCYADCSSSFHSALLQLFPPTLDHQADDLNPTTLPMSRKNLALAANLGAKKARNMQM